MSNITLVTTPDGNYEMIYVNDKFTYDGDIIYSFQWAKILDKYLPIESIQHWELSFVACDKYDFVFPKQLSNYDPADYRIRKGE